MKKIIVFLVLIIIINYQLPSTNIYNNSYEYSEQAFDVISYSLKFEVIDITKKQIIATNTIEINWNDTDNKNKFFFNLKALKIDSIYKNGSKIEFYENKSDEPLDQYYYIIKDDTLKKSTFKIYYGGTMMSEGGSMNWGGVHYSSNILFNMGVSFNDPVVSAARYWMPCYDHPQDKALFEAEFITPPNLVVASNGLLINEKINDGKKITNWKQEVPSTTYLMNFAISEFAKINIKNNDVESVIYSLKGDSIYSEIAYSNIEKMNDCFSEKYIPYPFEKIGYVNTPIGSMEHQTMISLARTEVLNSASQKDSNNSTIAHELSHSWFGNMVSPKDFRDTWFNEAFATHSEAIWASCVKTNSPWKNTGYNQIIADYWKIYINNIIKSEGILPLYNFKNYQKDDNNLVSYDNKVVNYPVAIYYKGATVVSHLRNEIGHDKFDNIMKEILLKYKHSNISTQEFIDEFSQRGEVNLSKFFDEWVYQKGFPILDINYSINQNKLILDIEQVQSEEYGKYSNIKIPLLISTNKDNYIRYYYLQNNKEILVDSLDENEIITKIEINNPQFEISPIKANLKLVSVENTDDMPNYILRNTSDLLVIDFSESIMLQEIQLFDLLGNQIYFEKTANEKQIIINKTSVSNGINFLKVFTLNNNVIIIKLNI